MNLFVLILLAVVGCVLLKAWWLLGSVLVLAVVYLALCWLAPLGHEDETGFHYDEEPKPVAGAPLGGVPVNSEFRVSSEESGAGNKANA